MNKWLFQEVIPQKQWRIGAGRAAKVVKHKKGFYDIQFALRETWKGQIALNHLPGSGVGSDAPGDLWVFAERSDLDRTISESIDNGIEFENGLVISSDFCFSFQPMADDRTRRECTAEMARLLKCVATSGEGETGRIQAQISDLQKAMAEFYIPGGQLRPINREGEFLFLAYSAAKNRKVRAVAAIRDAGLIQLADHIRDFYQIRPRSFSYCPDFLPNWLL